MSDSVDYTQRISEALTQADPALTISAVKSAVEAELRALDPTMRVENTGYFNHSYVPDFIASWPNDPNIKKRGIFLKISSQLDYLYEDIGLVSDQQPIVFGLGPTPSGNDSVKRDISEATQQSNTLVTDPGGLEELIDRKSIPFVSLASNAVAQGGRGIVDHANGAETARKLEEGFEGALAVELGSTLAATEMLSQLLDVKYADRMTDLLQAAWVGAGGQFADFPAKTAIARGHITDDALQFLLQYDEIDDRRFWARLGRKVTISQLGRLRLPHGSINLEHFIRANIDTLSARACRVLDSSQLTLDTPSNRDENGRLHWFVDEDRRLLALGGRTFTAIFGPNVSDLGHVKRRRTSGITIEKLLERAKYSTITEADFSLSHGARRTIKYISDDRSNLALDLQRGRILPEQDSSTTVLVKRAGAQLDGSPYGRVLSCDFQTSTAYRRTSSKISLGEIASEGIRLLHDLSREDLKALIELTLSHEEPDGYFLLHLLDLEDQPDQVNGPRGISALDDADESGPPF